MMAHHFRFLSVFELIILLRFRGLVFVEFPHRLCSSGDLCRIYGQTDSLLHLIHFCVWFTSPYRNVAVTDWLFCLWAPAFSLHPAHIDRSRQVCILWREGGHFVKKARIMIKKVFTPLRAGLLFEECWGKKITFSTRIIKWRANIF